MVVHPSSPAAEAKVPVGWYISSINGEKHHGDHTKVREKFEKVKKEGGDVSIVFSESDKQEYLESKPAGLQAYTLADEMLVG